MATAASTPHFLARGKPPLLRVTKAEGSFVFDERRRKYIDFIMGWCVGNFGWGEETLAAAAQDYSGPDYVAPVFAYKPWDDLAEQLLALAPANLALCFRASGGSEAVDIALQAALVHTGRQKFVALADSYHGNAIGGLSVGSERTREHCRNLLPHCAWLTPPLNADALPRLEGLLQNADVAAVILEPIAMNLGVLIPEAAFMDGLVRLCRQYGTLLIADEVACGFGRTGTLFAGERFALEPDLMCIAKAVTGGHAPLGAVLATEAVAASMEQHGNFYSTYGWHPRSVHVALATLRFIKRHRAKLFKQLAASSDYFRGRLEAMDFREAEQLHIAGLAVGIDVGNANYAQAIKQRAQDAGLIVGAQDRSLLLLPALNIEPEVAERGLDILERCL